MKIFAFDGLDEGEYLRGLGRTMAYAPLQPPRRPLKSPERSQACPVVQSRVMVFQQLGLSCACLRPSADWF